MRVNKHVKEFKKITRRLALVDSRPGCDITAYDDRSELACQGRCNDRRDQTILFPLLAEKVVLRGTDHLQKILKVIVQVALKDNDDA